MFFRASIVLSLLAVISGAEWALNTDTSATTVMGVGAGSETVAVAAAAANGVGALVEKLANGKWTKGQVEAGMLLDAATTAGGQIIASSVWGVFSSTDGKTFTTLTGINGASQNANVYGDNKNYFALVGNFVVPSPDGSKPKSVSGVATSKDNGATWALSSQVPPEWARYGAFPTESTWYVASGMWGSSAEDKVTGHRLTSRLHVDKVKGYQYNEIPKNGTVGATGWFGAVSKTTDGGATWTEVFHTDIENDYLYFNGIACPSTNHCVVTAEGYTADGDFLTTAYTTFDGATWAPTLVTSDVGMMQVDFVSENEGWIAGTKKDGRNLYGQFYKTTDGGKTWALQQSLNNCYCIDMDMASSAAGFAACSSSSGSSCSVAVYA